MVARLFVSVLLAGAASPSSLGPPEPGTLRLYLVRHAEVYANLDPSPVDMSKDQLDRLTPEGRRQAQALGSSLSKLRVNIILHSPSARTRATAELIRGSGRTLLREESLLRRVDSGMTASGKPLELSDRVATWKLGRDYRPPGGESLVDVGQRVAALGKYLASQGNAGVVLVTHAEVISAFLGHVRGTPGPRRYPPDVPLASISVVDVTSAGLKEVSAKYVPWSR